MNAEAGYATEGYCGYHRVPLPAIIANRICKDFLPSAWYESNSGAHTVKFSFAQFGTELKQDVLYGFPYNEPPAIEELMALPEHVAV